MFKSLSQRTVIIRQQAGREKSALAESLGRFNPWFPVIDLDLLNWEGNGYGRKRDEDGRTANDASKFSTQPLWIIEGVYGLAC